MVKEEAEGVKRGLRFKGFRSGKICEKREMHAMILVQDLALIMASAAVAAVICQRLKQPVVLGYILVGVLIGPNTPPFSLVANEDEIKSLAELGVVLLMFSVGLHFSFRKLKEVGVTAVVAAVVEVGAMFFLGERLGRYFGWSAMDSIFLGAIMSISSTTIIAKVLESLGFLRQGFAKLIFGILIIEDILAIAMMGLLTRLGTTGEVDLASSGQGLLKLILFCVAVAVVGFLVIPRLISLAGKSRSDEVLLITVLGMVFGLALWSAKLGYSIALGSFLVGAVVAEVKEVHRIERLVAPLRDLFSAIFFTSSGMLIRFDLSLQGVGQLALISFVLIFGKIGWVTFGALLGGCDMRAALRTGLSLAQIGEFSFIIAGLGMALGSTGSRLYSLAVLVSAVTTLTTPYLISCSGPVADWLERRGPRWFVDFWGWYHSGWKGFQSAPHNRRATARSMVRKLLGQLGLQLALMTAPIVGAAGLWQAYRNQLPEIFRVAWWGGPLFWLGGALLALPVVVAFIRKYHAFGILVSEMAFRRGEGNERAGPTRALATFLVCGMGYILLGSYLILISSPLLPSTHLVLGLVGAVAFLGLGIRRRLVKIYSQGQESIQKTWQVAPDQPPIQLPGNSQVRSYRVEKDSPLVGQTLHEIELRKRCGVVVVAIERADGNVVSPGPNEKVGIGDELFIFGGADQLNAAEEFFKTQQVTSV